jgi:hypothetical protein
MPCQLAPWEIEIERKKALDRRLDDIDKISKDQPKNIRQRLLNMALEDGWQKARRTTKELCQAWKMLFEILDADDLVEEARAIDRIKGSAMLKRHRVYYEAHKIGDKINKKAKK